MPAAGREMGCSFLDPLHLGKAELSINAARKPVEKCRGRQESYRPDNFSSINSQYTGCHLAVRRPARPLPASLAARRSGSVSYRVDRPLAELQSQLLQGLRPPGSLRSRFAWWFSGISCNPAGRDTAADSTPPAPRCKRMGKAASRPWAETCDSSHRGRKCRGNNATATSETGHRHTGSSHRPAVSAADNSAHRGHYNAAPGKFPSCSRSRC